MARILESSHQLLNRIAAGQPMGQRHTNLSIEKQAVEISMPHQNCTGMKLAKPPYILVVTRNGHMAEPVMDYAVNVAERMKCSILAAHINTLPFYRDGGRRSTLFTAAMQESMTLFEAKASGQKRRRRACRRRRQDRQGDQTALPFGAADRIRRHRPGDQAGRGHGRLAGARVHRQLPEKTGRSSTQDL